LLWLLFSFWNVNSLPPPRPPSAPLLPPVPPPSTSHMDGDMVWLVLVDFEEIENSGDDGMTVVSLFNKMLCGGSYHL
ncbi:hypothetical protein E1A91_A05G289200v1, partial [Gossypium mustelinum]